MSFQAGDELAHYEILEPIGKGGMGEVYRARDGKLGRDVAIKVLPDEFAQDTERLRRFQREAKVLASLNHPNIAAIYGVEHTDDTHYLVLELVLGETLAERIARSPIPFDEALAIAKKIAAALEQAHEQGIVHRDLKPANVKLTPDDDVKVLDFGLAKALAEDAPEGDSSMSPTITRDATRAGVILGTAAYMSPEQAKGKRVDKRTDIWAYGAVLYEMLTGKRAFRGEDVPDTLAAVLRAEPDLEALPAEVPSPTRALLQRCLVKYPRERLRDIGDASLFTDAPAGVSSRTTPSSRLPWVVALAAAVVAAIAIIVALGAGDASQIKSTHLSISLPPGNRLAFDAMSSVAISRDGARVAFSAEDGDTTRLFLRGFGSNLVQPIAGTEGAAGPVFSPDGTSLAYSKRSTQELLKITLGRETPVVLKVGGTYPGLSWDDDSLVVGLAPDFGIWRISQTGEDVERVTSVDGDFWHFFPDVLPERNAVLFTANKGPEGTDVDVIDLASGARRVVVRNASTPRYAPTGHLVFARESTLFAAPFDLVSLEVSGEPTLVVEGVWVHDTGGAYYGFSDTGTLVYAPRPPGRQGGTVLLVDREGNERSLLKDGPDRGDSRLSPDGGHIAFSRDGDVWLHDLQRQLRHRFTLQDSADRWPVWSPDGSRLVFASNRGGPYNLFWKSVETDEPATQLFPRESWQFASDWSNDGALIALTETNPSTGEDIWLYSVEARTASPFLTTDFDEGWGTFSPDGRWLAYESSESGQSEIFVRSIDGTGGRAVQISTSGGVEPRWSPVGGEIFFRQGQAMMVARVSTSPTLTAGTPEVLFEGNYVSPWGRSRVAQYDVTSDGNEFLMVRDADVAPVNEIRVVLNWFDELKRLVPTD